MTTQPHPRTPNLNLRKARRAMGLSQAQFADAMRAAGNAIGLPNNCTKRLVQKWETGEHATCRPEYLKVLRVVTGLAAGELGFPLAPSEQQDGMLDGAVGVPAAKPWPAMTNSYSDTRLESLDRLRRAIDSPSSVDPRAADLVEVVTAGLFDLEHHSPARLLEPTVERHLATVTSLLAASRYENMRRKLTFSAGVTALLAGWVAFDRGDKLAMLRYWDTSIAAAEGTGHNELLAGGLIYQSYAAARRDDPGTAWQLAHTASNIAPDDPRATAWATARSALHAAELGERESAEAAVERSLEIGLDLADPRPGDGGTPWTRSFDRARLLSSTARCMALLKSPPALDYAVQAVDALSAAKVKSHAVVLAEAALTAAIVGELKLCREYGSSAISLAQELRVSIAVDVLYEIIPIVLPYSDTRVARELLTELTLMTPPRDRDAEADQSAEGEVEAEDERQDGEAD